MRFWKGVKIAMSIRGKKSAMTLVVVLALLVGQSGAGASARRVQHGSKGSASAKSVQCGSKRSASAKNVQYGRKDLGAVLSHDVVRVGKTVSVVNSNTKKKTGAGYSYSSSNSAIACVNSEGVVTGKRSGEVQIKVKYQGKQKKLDLTVKSAKGKPELPVALDEVALQGVRMKKNAKNGYTYSAVVRNRAKKGAIKKIVYYYRVTVLVPDASAQKPGTATDTEKKPGTDATGTGSNGESSGGSRSAASSKQSGSTAQHDILPMKKRTKTVTLKATSIKPGKKSKRISCQGDYTGKIQSMKLTKILLYAGDALYEYNGQKKSGTLKWGAKDSKAPVFSGWVGKASCYNKEPIRICYSDRKKTYDFKDHVFATDARDGRVSFKADTSKINWNKDGIYKVYYTAKDQAGNVGKAFAKVQVFVPDSPESVADEVLGSLIKKKWSDEKKLRAIYNYVRGHCAYVDTGAHKNWRKVGLNGIRYQSGDCFTYYAVAKLLISRAGLYNLTVTRYPVARAHHWWNLVYVRGGWYHLDTTPRQRAGKFFLVTDAQLRGYSTGLTFSFNHKKYPKRAKKKISPNP